MKRQNKVGSRKQPFIVACAACAAVIALLSVQQLAPLSADASLNLTPAAATAASKADAWLEGMLTSGSPLSTQSTITPALDYPSTYTGPIQGSFALVGAQYNITDPNTVRVSFPTALPDDYRGTITGTVTVAPSPNRWIVQAYKRTAAGTVQVPAQALADGTTGGFTLDTSEIPITSAGQWFIGLLDATAGYAPSGALWPAQPVYEGLELQQLIVTDSAQLWSTQPAPSSGNFWFDTSAPGTKMFRLIDTASGSILAEQVDLTGLIRSYSFAPGETGYGTALSQQTFVYDQGLALISALAMKKDQRAKILANGILLLQTHGGPRDGGFVFMAPQLNPPNGAPYYRSGAHAIALEALLSYIQSYPNDPDINTYRQASLAGLRFLDGTLSKNGLTSGLYLGGYGLYTNVNSPAQIDTPTETNATTPEIVTQEFDPSFTIDWASTEHNLDIWHTLQKAAIVLHDATYTASADALKKTINSKLYSKNDNRFYQGLSSSGPDKAQPLDVNSWGSVYLQATQQITQSRTALKNTTAFRITDRGVSGYTPFIAGGGYPGAIPTVWFEGSFGVLLAQYRAGKGTDYQSLTSSLLRGQQTDGSFRYATTADPTYGIGTGKSVAATAWYILATVGRDAIWNAGVG